MIETAIITKDELKKVAGFRPKDAFVVSLYLNVDGLKYPRIQDYQKELRLMLGRARREWVESDEGVDRPKKRSLQHDLKALEAFVVGEWKRDGSKGLAAFFCGAADFQQVYDLPVPVPSALLVGNEPYTKTLTAVLDEYKRFCVAAVDRRKTRFFTVYLGQIEEHEGVFVDEWMPDQVKTGEWASLRQSRIARHIEDHLMHHLKDSARLTFNFFLEHHFDRLVVAGRPELVPKFLHVLHPYLRERFVGQINIEPDAPVAEILEKSLTVEREIEAREEQALIHRLNEQKHPGGLGVSGLSETIAALMRGQAHTLLIGNSYRTDGFVCYRDHYLDSRSGNCPVCGERLIESGDIIEDMVQVAINQNVQVEHISHIPQFARDDKVGALLRFGL